MYTTLLLGHHVNVTLLHLSQLFAIYPAQSILAHNKSFLRQHFTNYQFTMFKLNKSDLKVQSKYTAINDKSTFKTRKAVNRKHISKADRKTFKNIYFSIRMKLRYQTLANVKKKNK